MLIEITKKCKAYLGLITLVIAGNLFSKSAFPQQRIVSVNKVTGALNLVIPVTKLTSGSLSLPISLAYNGTGVKVKDVESSAGMSWNIMAGGQVTRELRGLPDDCMADMQGSSRLGWLHSNKGSTIQNTNFQNDGQTATCSDENNDLNALASFNDLADTEPDVFTVDAPGLHC